MYARDDFFSVPISLFLIILIHRYKNDSSGNAILRTALALCYYHALPVELTDYIFNVQFFNQLDREIQTSFNVSERYFPVIQSL